jgi:hypothetical protein
MKHTLTAILIATGLAACGTTLPRLRPADLTVKMTRNGVHPGEGKPTGDELVLARSIEAHYKVDYEGGSSITVALEVSDEDLDRIYEVLRENAFDAIGSMDGEEHGPGTWITIAWEGQQYTAHMNGDPGASPKIEQGWENVVSALRDYRKREVEDKDFGIPAVFDPTLYNAGIETQKDLGSD